MLIDVSACCADAVDISVSSSPFDDGRAIVVITLTVPNRPKYIGVKRWIAYGTASDADFVHRLAMCRITGALPPTLSLPRCKANSPDARERRDIIGRPGRYGRYGR